VTRGSLKLFFFSVATVAACSVATAQTPTVFGFKNFGPEAKIEAKFLAVPEAKLAGEHLKTLTAEPHLAATDGDRHTVDYVVKKFREAGLETEIVPYRVLLNHPKQIKLEAWDASGKLLVSGPTPEHVEGDAFENDPRAFQPFHGASGSGDVTADVVYANYGRLEDFDRLAASHVDLRGKIVLVRYGQNFRGIKVQLAEQRGAVGVIIYSDPADDGFVRGNTYPNGPWRPETAVQFGSVQFLSRYSGDPETPGVASTLDLPDAKRVSPKWNQPQIPSIPISYHDAAPLLQALTGAAVPEGWQGGLKFPYHMGSTGSVKVHLVSLQDYQRRVIWDVMGTVKGREQPEERVLVGNHRDAWIFGAVDPSSGTAAMLETVHGVGALLKSGWRPRRTLVFASWDAEEEGMMGSTEWVEQHMGEMAHVVAYFNTDVAVAGPNFSAEAVPSLKQFVREAAKSVESPLGGTVYSQWKLAQSAHKSEARSAETGGEVHINDMGSGSDYSPFLEHAGVPSTDIGSGGSYGVYHSVFDNYQWFTQNADPKFAYLEQQARMLGIEALRMADAEVLPLDYTAYAQAVNSYLAADRRKATDHGVPIDFIAAEKAADRFAAAAALVHKRQTAQTGDLKQLNHALRQVEADLIDPVGPPNRPWYRHTVFAPGEFAGYAAVVLPGVSEALDARNAPLATQQLAVLTEALNRAAKTLETAR
jgi:N-acetylated-alpha-linked acidic dipeptidase